MAAALGRVDLPERDRALVHELVYGTLRHAPFLDFCLANCAHKPLSKLPIPVWMALRLGAYQLLRTRIPAHTAVHESVALVVAQYGRMRGVVNAMLRQLARLQEAAQLPDPSQTLADPVEAMAVSMSHPAWLVRDVLQRRGLPATQAWLAANNEAPPVCIRVNRCRSDVGAVQTAFAEHGVEATPLAHMPDMLRLGQSGYVPDLPGFATGTFCVQDPAASLVARLAAPLPGQTVLDACAAPGGKATQLAELMGDTGRVFALDVHPGRTRLIEANARRLQLRTVTAAALDVTDIAALDTYLVDQQAAQVDVAMIDAPCSGLGTLRRNPELRVREAASVASLCALQAKLLDAVAHHVRPGGRLVYAVCTVTADETLEQIKRFLRRWPEFTVQAPPAELAPFCHGTAIGPAVQTWTDVHATDSFFAVALERRID